VARWTGLRSRVDQLLARVRALGLRETVSIERDVFRRILKSTVAATLAWLAAEAIDSPRPALASLAAIIVVQITVRATLARSIQLTVAVSLGLGASVALGHVAGVHWWTVALIVLAGLIAGELFRLGAMSGQVAISAMLALSLGSGYGITRVIDTAVGAVIGVLVNALIAPPSHVSEASRTLRGLGEDLGALLDDIGSGLARQPSTDTISRWLTRARDLGADSRAAIGTVKQGEESLQFNPLARRELDQLSRLTEARRALDHAVTQTRGIARSLLDLPQPFDSAGLGAVLTPLGGLIRAAGGAVAAFGRLQERPESRGDRYDNGESLRLARTLADRVAVAVAREAEPAENLRTALSAPDDTGSDVAERAATGRLLASILVDVERLLHEVDVDHGAHTGAVAEPEPA
jgi:uncharacterized membrane protein YccC